jgi:hypothetical protein
VLNYEAECSSKPDPYKTGRHSAPPAIPYSNPYTCRHRNPTAGGDPAEVEKAKTALRSAAIGYGLAILAPVIVTVLKSLVGG